MSMWRKSQNFLRVEHWGMGTFSRSVLHIEELLLLSYKKAEKPVNKGQIHIKELKNVSEIKNTNNRE